MRTCAHPSAPSAHLSMLCVHPSAPSVHPPMLSAHLLHTIVHPFAHLCAPLHTSLRTISWACHPYLAFHRPRTPLATLGNPASAQLGTAPTLDLCGIKSKPSGPHMGHPFRCGLAQPTQPSKDLVRLGHHCQSGISFHCSKPCGRLTYCSSHGPWVGNFFLLGKSLIVIPRGLQGLGPKGGIGVLGYPSLHMTHPLH